MFALFSALSVALSIRATSRSHHRAAVVEIAGRQRTLAERYVRGAARPQAAARPTRRRPRRCCSSSADALLDGGEAPAVNGDDDETGCRRPTGSSARQLVQERRLVHDLTATGSALLAGQSPIDVSRSPRSEKIAATDPGAAPRRCSPR